MPEPFDKTGEVYSPGEDVLIRPEEYREKNPPQKTEYPCLEMLSGPGEGMTVPLKTGEFVIGRSKENPIHLDDTSVSRAHSRLVLEKDRIVISDLASRNGTYVNGKKIGEGEHPLNHLDQVKIGIYVFRLLARAPTPAEEEEALRQEEARSSKAATFVAQSDEPVGEVSAKIPPHNAPSPLPLPPSFDTAQDKRGGGIKGGGGNRGGEGGFEAPDEPPQPGGEIKDDSFERKNAFMVPLEQVQPARLDFRDEPFGLRFGLLKNIFIVICAASVLAGLLYLLYSNSPTPPPVETTEPQQGAPSGPAKLEGEVSAEIPPNPPQDAPSPLPLPLEGGGNKGEGDSRGGEGGFEAPEAPVAPLAPVQPTAGEPDQVIHQFNVFLDVTSAPTTARIFFGGEPIGQTPTKVSVPVETGKEYEVTAEFDLKDIRDRYRQKLTFRADPRKEVVPLMFDADIGVIKIQKLPRQVSFYLEGYYAHDKYKANPVRLTDIIYGKPIYVPFGSYVIELREKTRMGDSDTFVDEIRYHRQLEVNADRKVIELTVNDRDLQFFPAIVQSVPSGADIYFDGERVGATPYTGELPLGKHELKLMKEGYFDNVMPLDMRTNTQFEAKIELKTSKVGEFINRAREYRHVGQHKQAIDELVEALKLEAGTREKAEIHLLLGDSYFMMGNNQNALTYFEQAKGHPAFYYRALVGSARAQLASGNRIASLTSLVEVFLNITDADPLKKEALGVFKQLSPLKSVLYVSTEPAGATVYVNNQEVSQKTPVILSDLALGNYRIEIQKTGFEPQQIKKNLKLTEFVPILVKLTPQKL